MTRSLQYFRCWFVARRLVMLAMAGNSLFHRSLHACSPVIMDTNNRIYKMFKYINVILPPSDLKSDIKIQTSLVDFNFHRYFRVMKISIVNNIQRTKFTNHHENKKRKYSDSYRQNSSSSYKNIQLPQMWQVQQT